MSFRLFRFVLATSMAASAHAEGEPLSFNRDIRPILSDKCFACHGFDAKHRKAELRLDTLEGGHGKSKSGAVAIQPGNPAGSEVWKRINETDPEEIMPPPDSHKTLTAAEKEVLKKWMEQGASYQRHWSFEPPVKSAVPPIPPGMPARNEVDAFIFDRLKKEGLTPLPEADKETLIRRITFALTGLPPNLPEVEAFLADASADAYE